MKSKIPFILIWLIGVLLHWVGGTPHLLLNSLSLGVVLLFIWVVGRVFFLIFKSLSDSTDYL